MDDRTPTQLSWRPLGPLAPLAIATLVAIAHYAARPGSDSGAAVIASSQAAPAAAAAPAAPTPPTADEESNKQPDEQPSDEPADASSEIGDHDSSEAAEDSPVTEVPCITEDTELTTDGKTAILCRGEHCRTVGHQNGYDGPVPTPPQRYDYEEAPSVTDASGAPEICTDDDCTHAGPRLAAALLAARDAGTARATAESARIDDEETLRTLFDASATRDHRVVTFHGPNTQQSYPPYVVEVWDVRRDRQLTLRPPPSYATRTGFLIALEPIGDLMIASWTDEAGPSTRAIIVDRNGRNRGGEFEAGELVQQTLDRFIVIGDAGALTVIDHGRATAAGVPGAGPAIGVRIDDHRIAALVREPADVFRLLSIVDGQARTSDMFPGCSAPDRLERSAR